MANERLTAALEAAATQVGTGVQRFDSQKLTELRYAIEQAEEKGVRAATVRAAQERLADLQADAQMKVLESQIAMGLRRATLGNRADVATLAKTIIASLRAGMERSKIEAAIKIVATRGTDEEREWAKLLGRLDRFEALAERGEEGERQMAATMLTRAREKLREYEGFEDFQP